MQNLNICSVCSANETTIVTDPESGEIVCSKCGTVALTSIQESRKEWK